MLTPAKPRSSQAANWAWMAAGTAATHRVVIAATNIQVRAPVSNATAPGDAESASTEAPSAHRASIPCALSIRPVMGQVSVRTQGGSTEFGQKPAVSRLSGSWSSLSGPARATAKMAIALDAIAAVTEIHMSSAPTNQQV